MIDHDLSGFQKERRFLKIFSPFLSKKKPTGYAGGGEGQRKGFSSSKRQYTKKLRCAKLNVRLATVHKKSTQEDVLMKNQENDTFSLAHTTWKCQYHIVFTPKYHRKVIYGALRTEIGKILRELCKRKGVEIIEAHAMPDHIHMLVSIPPNERVSSFMGYLKGKSTMIIFERYARLKYKYGNRHFWSRGYYVSTVGGNKQAVQKYIQNQEKEDLISAQISMVEYYDPFEQWLKSNQKK